MKTIERVWNKLIHKKLGVDTWNLPYNVESDSTVLSAVPDPISSSNWHIICPCLFWFSVSSCCLVASFERWKRFSGKLMYQTPGSHKNNLDNKWLNMENVLCVKNRILSFFTRAYKINLNSNFTLTECRTMVNNSNISYFCVDLLRTNDSHFTPNQALYMLTWRTQVAQELRTGRQRKWYKSWWRQCCIRKLIHFQHLYEHVFCNPGVLTCSGHRT